MLIVTAWGGAFLAALWLSLIVWTYRDIRARARDPLGRILAVLVVAVLFLPGIVVSIPKLKAQWTGMCANSRSPANVTPSSALPRN